MRSDLDLPGRSSDWLAGLVQKLIDEFEVKSPVEYNEESRYLPPSVSRFSGYIQYDLTPYWIEILNNFDLQSPVRETIVKKGVQVAYTTALESVIFYVAGAVKTAPAMFATADAGLAAARMANNILPMFQQSGLDIFQSSDTENTRKKGATKTQLQWIGGGYLIPYGALNGAKMRQFSIMFMLMDEVDAWRENLAGGGDPIRLFKDRCAAFWSVRKVMIGSTPLIKGASHIDRQFARGDQREYRVRCLKCGFPQALRMSGRDSDKGREWGFKWDYLSNGELDLESARYHCANCDHPHFEHDKPKLINKNNAEWIPTAEPKEPGIRSYHIPAFLSPAGVQPWSKAISLWLEAFDPVANRVRDVRALQIFYNNVLGESFELMGSKITFIMASAHRRRFYLKKQIPNSYISQYCPSRVLLLTCSVDVHPSALFVSVWGWTADMCCWLIDYERWDDTSEAGCGQLGSPVWSRLQALLEEAVFAADDGVKYRIAITLVDSGWSASTVTDFCAQYESGVYPIVGRDRTSKVQSIQEFATFRTQAGTTGYRILVDHYKDRIAPVLRREWTPELGEQQAYTFNAPMDATDEELKELTREVRREKELPNGGTVHYWHRPHGAANELWDCLVYAHAAVEIVAWSVCTQYFGDDTIDWKRFWDYVREGGIFEA